MGADEEGFVSRTTVSYWGCPGSLNSNLINVITGY